jgi:capsular exopolysaccharide synthesis family protein
MSNIIKRDQPGNVSNRNFRHQELTGYPREDAIDVHRILERFLKRKYYILLVFLLVVIPAAIATNLTTPLYQSTALIQVNPDPVQVLPYRDVAGGPVGGANFENYMGTQEQILRGGSLMSRVGERLSADVQDATAAAEAANLSDRYGVRKIEKSQLFELSYLAPSPDAAANVVNLFAEEFVKHNFQMRQATREKAEQDLKKELEALEGRLQLSEKDLITYAQTNNILSLEQNQVDPIQQKLSVLTQQAADAEGRRAVARAGLASIQNASLSEFPQRFVTTQIGTLDARIFELEQELITLRSKYGENWPAVIERRNEMELVREQLVREKTAVLERQREEAMQDLQNAEARHSLASAALEEQEGLVNRFHDASIQYNILKREVDTNRNLYDGLLERLKQTGVLAGFQFGDIQVVEPGRPNPEVYSPKILWNLGLASLLGLTLGICLVILLDFWDTSISTLEEAEQLAVLPSLGSVPLMKALKPGRAAKGSSGLLFSKANGATSIAPKGNGSAALFPTQDTSLPFEVAESIRAICASILLSRSDERPRVIVVTSATPNEGKTTLVGHLGRAFADAGSTTLLVEADLRKPDLSRSFSIGNEDGLSLYLAGHVSPLPKIHQTEFRNLSVTAAGPIPPNPAALLHSERLGSFLKAAAAEYQIVILDAPPLLSAADARLLGIEADGVLLVVRAGRTAKNLVRRACSLLDSSGANVLGMVLNGVAPDRSELAYYNHYSPTPQA